MLKYFDAPIIEIESDLTVNAGVKILVKREDFNHPIVSGNKWWKLKYNLEEAEKLENRTLLTFGGAYSNHIYASAGAAKELNLKSIGVIRGEEVLPLNSTLAFAKDRGMKLHFVSREDYRKKSQEYFIQNLKEQFGDFYLIPEGGSNSLAVKGCAEFAREKLSLIDFDYLCLPVGTGGTMAGIIAGLEGKKSVLGFSVLKNGDFLNEEVRRLLQEYSEKDYLNWSIQTDYHFGGYAKKTSELEKFILQMKHEYDLNLDPIYTGKMVAGVFDLIKKNYFPRGSTILLLHTGGLQSI
ncbi:MAG TPA: pyridoxal-phosphate dependent enzyme [Cyclobacteriaceae bacterium]|jgi:1-aminocyclopropane-1-carboxylate deaminase/D-cysteine desulfhydrase-like pyridoxal-dependent ACC family enzyme|nr:pyridoxal-phosphate dependent enzyme [Cyclobacteriaceae bacterium]